MARGVSSGPFAPSRTTAVRITGTTFDGNVVGPSEGPSRGGGLSIEIEGLLIMSPAPERLKLRTLIDLDNGRATTRAAGG